MAQESSELLVCGEDGKHRCWWCAGDSLYMDYHDNEWGKPVRDDIRLFEKICLEGFQAGLSWLTILKRREGFRKAFADFDFCKVAKFTDKRVDKLVQDEGIIRHRGKIESTINNAARAILLQKEFGTLADYFWQYAPESHPTIVKKDDIVATTPQSTAMSKDLKKRGWTFVGPTTCYAFMQSMGMVNDHVAGCHAG